MKPKIFLSHSKKDKQLIQRIANDLRSSGIDVWYDEWEIPVGDSIRKKIFEDGIPNCDAFFVYLSDYSVDSYWVQKELDSAIFKDSEERNSFLILFVDKDETRRKLPSDLKSLNIPAINEDNYILSLSRLISKAWQAFTRKALKNQFKSFEQDKLNIEKEKLELEKRLFALEKKGAIDLVKIKEYLNTKKIEIGILQTETFLQAFHRLKYKLAEGATTPHIRHVLEKALNPNLSTEDFFTFDSIDNNIQEFVGELIIQGIVQVIPPTNDYSPYNILTDLGIQLARESNS